MTTLAVIEVLDRDGSVRHSVSAHAWPLRVGRALDNDLVLDDAHTAAHHFSVAPDADGRIAVTVGDSVNGLLVGAQRLSAGQQAPIDVGPADPPPELVAGRTHLRLRLPAHALLPEQRLRVTRVRPPDLSTLGLLALLVAGALLFGTWLESDPEVFTKALSALAISTIGIAMGWSGLWTLLSKVFTRQGHFGWHVRVLLTAALAWQVVTALSSLLAFALSWPWIADYDFVAGYLILGAMLYFHLQAVEPNHPRRTQAFAVSAVVAGLALSLWTNYQSTDRLGGELYMNHLFPPALRLAQPVQTDRFMDGVAGLQQRLDEKAKDKSSDE